MTQLQDLKMYVIEGWPLSTADIKQDIWHYWTFRDELVMIYGVSMKVKWIITPEQLHSKALEQLHNNRMSLENTSLLAWDLLY